MIESIVSVNYAPTVAVLFAYQTATEDTAFAFTVSVDTFADSDVGDALSYTGKPLGRR